MAAEEPLGRHHATGVFRGMYPARRGVLTRAARTARPHRAPGQRPPLPFAPGGSSATTSTRAAAAVRAIAAARPTTPGGPRDRDLPRYRAPVSAAAAEASWIGRRGGMAEMRAP